MSLYNRLFGENEDATALLGMLNLTRNEFGRYRDVYLNKEGTVITVLARVGGANRKEYRQVFNNMMHNEYYYQSYDDDFDKTYTYFEFKVPDKYSDVCKKIAPKEDRLSVGKMFKKEIQEAEIPGSDASKRMNAIAAELFENFLFGEGSNGINIIKL